jgi:diguanylate cyclase (GGDEF)-like protein
VDVDDLKAVNDTFGHSAGNATLRGVADVFRDTLRAADGGFRWGGDEFAVIAPHTSAEDAVRLAERIMDRVQRASLSWGGLSVSIGIASLVPDPQNVAASSELLVQQADAALYRAKQEGRSCYRTAGVSV